MEREDWSSFSRSTAKRSARTDDLSEIRPVAFIKSQTHNTVPRVAWENEGSPDARGHSYILVSNLLMGGSVTHYCDLFLLALV